ncbi:DUF2695 domain-containing protein [Nocardioides marinus]|jgi:hypothetical protein|uniref:DUF2695 domain-containing protein n=1 Tax=Nocardioides marinus TaxID=374514 RepID=A0A7Y9YFF0_9ACTN|nr:DUF2695 domain-containing protein [Nocardioides marinus]MAO80727.1 hypothetical protein [Nocardioides sp.]NYI11203.1 hypothetical protein [Nocardioides marinus]
MEQQRVVRDAEEYLQLVVAEVMAPHPAECVLCYVARMLGEHGCDETLRWTGRFRELRSPRATALEGRMQAVGGFCDCEVFLNGYRLRREHLERDIHTDELRAPDHPPTCAGVGRLDSTKPCTLWERSRRRSLDDW